MFKACHKLIFFQNENILCFIDSHISVWGTKILILIVFQSLFLCLPISFISFIWQAMEASWKRTWMKMTKDGSTGRYLKSIKSHIIQSIFRLKGLRFLPEFYIVLTNMTQQLQTLCITVPKSKFTKERI